MLPNGQTNDGAVHAPGSGVTARSGAGQPVVEFNSFSLTYPESDAPVLRDINLTIHAGERVLLLGPSGCGKSSLLNVVLGLVPGSTFARTEGVARVFGVSGASAVERADRLAAVFQDPDSQLCMLSVDDEVAFGLENINLDPQIMESRIEYALQRVGLAGMRWRRVDRLSGGQKQRLVLACAIAADPELLVLDEPCSNLDTEGVAEFARILSEPAGIFPRTVILVEHRIDHILESITRVIVLDSGGRLRFDGEPERVFGEHAVELDRMGVWLPTGYRRASPQYGVQARKRTSERSVDTAGAPLLEMRDVHFAYEREPPVFSGLSFEMYGGEAVAVLGPNGSGKTTLAKLACGLLRPTAGSVRVSGRHPHRIPARELPGILGYVFQNPEHQFVRDSVREEVAFTLERRPLEEAERNRRVQATLRRLSLEGLENRNPFTLSHGQKRRLSAATMLVAGAPLIAFDEPTFGQDWGHLIELEQMLEELSADGVGLLIITHDVDLAHRHADRILFVPSEEISSAGEIA